MKSRLFLNANLFLLCWEWVGVFAFSSKRKQQDNAGRVKSETMSKMSNLLDERVFEERRNTRNECKILFFISNIVSSVLQASIRYFHYRDYHSWLSLEIKLWDFL